MTIRIRPALVGFTATELHEALDARGLAALLTSTLLDAPNDDAPEAKPTAKAGTGWLRWTNTQRALIPGLD